MIKINKIERLLSWHKVRTFLFLRQIPLWEKEIMGKISFAQADMLDEIRPDTVGHFIPNTNTIVFRSDNITSDTFLHEWGHAFDDNIGKQRFGTKISETKRWEYLYKKHKQELLSARDKDFSTYHDSELKGEAFAESYVLLRKGELTGDLFEVKSFFLEIEHTDKKIAADKLFELSRKAKILSSKIEKDTNSNRPPKVKEEFKKEWASSTASSYKQNKKVLGIMCDFMRESLVIFRNYNNWFKQHIITMICVVIIIFLSTQLLPVVKIYLHIHEFGHGGIALVLAQNNLKTDENFTISWVFSENGPIQTKTTFPGLTNIQAAAISLGGGVSEILIILLSYFLVRDVKITFFKKERDIAIKIFVIGAILFSLFHSLFFADTDGFALGHQMRDKLGVVWELVIYIINYIILPLAAIGLFIAIILDTIYLLEHSAILNKYNTVLFMKVKEK